MQPLIPTVIATHPLIAARGIQDKRRDISSMLLALQTMGRFLITCSGDAYFFDEATRQVVSITEGDREFMRIMGTHRVCPDKSFIERARRNALTYGTLTEIYSISHVNTASSSIYVHSQGAKVYKVTASDIITINNGDDGVYFMAETGSTPFSLVDPLPTADDLFYDLLVKPLRFATGTLDEEQARFLLIAWFCSLFLPGLLPVSPMLVLVGPASSGKTTFLRNISELLFGKQLSVVRMPGDDKMFDAVIGKRSLVGLDGVTEWSGWLDKRLESIARKESIFIRKGQGYVEQRLDCSMAITTRQFPDEGLQCINRLLPIVLKRPERVLTELSLANEVKRNRNVIMTQLLIRLQRLLINLGTPSCGYSGSFMSADFADVAYRMARSIGFDSQVSDAFDRLSSLYDAVFTAEQQTMQLLDLWIGKTGNEGRQVKAAELHKELSEIAEQQGKTISMGKRPFAHWLARSIAILRQTFSIEQLKKRSRQQFYAFSRTIGGPTDKEFGV